MEKLRIAILSVEFTPYINGGLGRYLEQYTQYLLAKGHQLEIFTFNPGDLPEREISEGLKVHRPFKEGGKIFSYNLVTYQLLQKMNKEQELKFDLISVHDWMSCPAAIMVALRFKIPVVFHVHNTEYSMCSWGQQKMLFKLIAVCERLMAGLARQIIVPSAKLQELLLEHGWNQTKIRVIHHGFTDNGADLSVSEVTKLSSSLREQMGISARTKVLLFVGRLVYAKGIFQLITTMREVARVYPDSKLLVVGQGEPETVQQLRELIDQLGLKEQIQLDNQFLSQAQVMKYYLLADLCVFPSLYEPFGLVALEAMAFAKPVILGAGFAEIFGGTPERKTALLIKSAAPSELAAGILSLLQNSEQANEMGRAAQSFVKQNFTWEKTFQTTLAVYERAVMVEKEMKPCNCQKYQ